ASDARVVFGVGKTVADGLSIFSTALDHVGDQHDLVVGGRIQVRRVCVVLGFEVSGKILRYVARIGRIELNDADVAQRGLPRFLPEAERQPYGADLNGVAAAAFGDPGLCQRLRDLEALPFEGVSRNHVDFAETG